MPDTTTPTDLTGWCTLAAAAETHHKSLETIRRWTRTYPHRLRTRTILGTRYLNEADLADLASEHPPGEPDRTACAEAGHRPRETTRAALDDWISLGAAMRLAGRSKPTIIRWANDGDVDSVRCECGRRRYILEAELAGAKRRNERSNTHV